MPDETRAKLQAFHHSGLQALHKPTEYKMDHSLIHLVHACDGDVITAIVVALVNLILPNRYLNP